jgi:hypothetical protein
MKVYNKAEFLARTDLERAEVILDEASGAGVFVRQMKASERSKLEDMFTAKKLDRNTGEFRWQLIKRCVVDGEGVRLLGDKDKDPTMSMGAALIEQVFEAACELNGFRDKDVEDIEKK